MRSLPVVILLLIAVRPLPAQFATTATAQPGITSGGGIFNLSNVLGGPRGAGVNAGSLHVLSLGAGGSVTVGFGEDVVDGPGADIIVFENGFVVPGTTDVFSEAVYVEVSSNGADYVRFPSRYRGPVGPLPQYGGVAPGSYSGLAGGLPVLADVTSNTIDPLDPTVAGGEAFDLTDLASAPAVLAGVIDLSAISHVRLVDVVAGLSTDSMGNPIFDNGGNGSADVDAVGAINRTSTVSAGQPEVRLWMDALGHVRLRLEDPDGLADLDGTTFMFSFNLAPVPAAVTAVFWVVDAVTATSLELRSFIALYGLGFKGMMAVSIRDLGGEFSTDQFALQG